MKLFRPVGVRELELIAESGWMSFPPRLPHQPIFYPVLSFQYAEAIAKNWNTKDAKSGFAGFVTAFEIDDDYGECYPVQIVGGHDDRELWVPAEELDQFNQHIQGRIRCETSYYGTAFSGAIDPATLLPLSVVNMSVNSTPLKS